VNDIHALSGAYVVEALDDHERELFEQHLADCAACQAEVAGLREASAMLAETTYAAPPPALRDKVLADIGKVRPLPPLPEQKPVVRDLESVRRRRFPVGLAAAAAVLAVLGAGAVATQPWQDDASKTLTAAERVLQASDAERVSVQLGGAEATVVRSVSEGRAVIVTKDMPPPPGGKVYELWLQRPEGNMVPAGLMPPGSDNTVLLEGDASDAIGAGVTVEPAPDGSQVPTTTPIALFDFEQAT
jgi:anti-sigma-K factor RskA